MAPVICLFKPDRLSLTRSQRSQITATLLS